MAKPIILTGIKPTGFLHLGNLLGAVKPAVSLSQNRQNQGFYFLADYHALITVKNGQELNRYTMEMAASWIALGLDPDNVVLYRQSDVPEIFELAWILGCFTPKGLMNRAHAYKAKRQHNESRGERTLDAGINMGLFTYPLLMAADILVMQTRWVPVGRDQGQHIEITRHIAQAFNHAYNAQVFVLPEALTEDTVAVIPGLDGQKMSKSYGNTIPVFATRDALRALIFRIATDSTKPGEAKNPDNSILFQIFRAIATKEETDRFYQQFVEGIGWQDAKEQLFDLLDRYLTGPRQIYQEIMHDPTTLRRILEQGATKARDQAQSTMKVVRRQTKNQLV